MNQGSGGGQGRGCMGGSQAGGAPGFRVCAKILDAPPGTSCPVIATLRDTGFVILVTEPAPFGLHDLKLAVDMVRGLHVPFGVVVNRMGIGDGFLRIQSPVAHGNKDHGYQR